MGSIPVRDDGEIMVVDDHNRKNPRSFSAEFPRVVFLKAQFGSKGAGAARNTGLKIASGNWLLFAHADDTFVVGAFDILGKYQASCCDMFFLKGRREGCAGISCRHLRYVALIELLKKLQSLD